MLISVPRWASLALCLHVLLLPAWCLRLPCPPSLQPRHGLCTGSGGLKLGKRRRGPPVPSLLSCAQGEQVDPRASRTQGLADSYDRIRQEDKLLSQQGGSRVEMSQTERVATLQSTFKDQLILAPLTRGGNLPFRRLCADFGANVTYSEMAYARVLLRDNLVGKRERTRLYRAQNEQYFGLQIATNVISEGVFAGKLALESGIDFIDLNCGCPTFDVTRRGLGSALLKKPKKLARLVEGIVDGCELPVTVKLRLGISEVNIDEIVDACVNAGAKAVTIHGRTQEQRYYAAADWATVQRVGGGCGVPVVGNGDIVTHYEAYDHLGGGGVSALMTGRGALIKPWLFQEYREGATWSPDARERVHVYRRLAQYMKEHFGGDAWGRQKAFYFLPWHFGFFFRYRALPEEAFGEFGRVNPGGFMQKSREVDAMLRSGGEELGPLDRLLRRHEPGLHEKLAEVLWDADCDADAVLRAQELARIAEHQAFAESLSGAGGGRREKAEEVPFE